jgi:hypothetical protein
MLPARVFAATSPYSAAAATREGRSKSLHFSFLVIPIAIVKEITIAH